MLGVSVLLMMDGLSPNYVAVDVPYTSKMKLGFEMDGTYKYKTLPPVELTPPKTLFRIIAVISGVPIYITVDYNFLLDANCDIKANYDISSETSHEGRLRYSWERGVGYKSGSAPKAPSCDLRVPNSVILSNASIEGDAKIEFGAKLLLELYGADLLSLKAGLGPHVHGKIDERGYEYYVDLDLSLTGEIDLAKYFKDIIDMKLAASFASPSMRVFEGNSYLLQVSPSEIEIEVGGTSSYPMVYFGEEEVSAVWNAVSDIVKIDETGIHGVSSGEAKIIATHELEDGTIISADCLVTVIDNNKVGGIDLNGDWEYIPGSSAFSDSGGLIRIRGAVYHGANNNDPSEGYSSFTLGSITSIPAHGGSTYDIDVVFTPDNSSGRTIFYGVGAYFNEYYNEYETSYSIEFISEDVISATVDQYGGVHLDGHFKKK